MTDVSTSAPQDSAHANRWLPHLRSELARLWHRRLYRILSLLLVAGVIVVSAVVFFNSSKTVNPSADALRNYQSALDQFNRQFAQDVVRYQRCVEQVPAGQDPSVTCGPQPNRQDMQPRLAWFYPDPRYDATSKLPAVAFAICMAMSLVGFVLGASAGGAEWASRSMTLQLLWETRRLRLLSIKWVGLAIIITATTVASLLVGLALGWVTYLLRGTPDVTDGRFNSDFLPNLLADSGRGLVFAVVITTVGFALAMLVRNTGAALGVAFVYFAVAENAVRVAFEKFGPEPYLFGTNSVAFLVPGGVDVPGARLVASTSSDGFASYTTSTVHLSNGRGLVALLCYLLVLVVPAVYSFTRRDVS